MSGAQVLVVDDEPHILGALRTTLCGAGYEVTTAATGDEALAAAGAHLPDAVILDLLLPDAYGTDVCRALRRLSDVPIVIFSAVGDEQEKAAALAAGADDYVTKPFAVDELLARLGAVLRRATTAGSVIEVGELVVDLEKRAVTIAGRAISLKPREFELLRYLAQNEGKLLTHSMIVREVWGSRHGDESRYLHVHVSQLRRKIEHDPARPRYLLTEPGAGYRLVNPVATGS